MKKNAHLNPEKGWRLLRSNLVHKSPYVLVYRDDVQLPDETIIQYTRVDEPSFTVVVPTMSDKLVMIYNYRYPLNEWCLEFPAGHIESGESPRNAARRELHEETGYIAKGVRLIGEFCPSVRSSQKAYVFISEISKKGVVSRDALELQRVVILPVDEVYRKLSTGAIKHAASVVALAYARPLLCKVGVEK